jgi:type VI secretion system protein VasD
MIQRRRLLAAPAIAAVVLLWGCAPPPPPPPVLDLQIVAGADQNPDTAGKPAPVAVHMYQLGATAKFERADVFAVTEREAATLGTDVLASEAFVLSPGETRTIARELKIGTQFIGIVVLFRDIDHATWRAIAKVAPNGPSALKLTTTGIVATLAPR